MAEARNPEDTPVRVTDRRRFTETGDVRAQAPEPAPAPVPPPSVAESSGRTAEREPAPDGAGEPAIVHVFFVFWQSAMLALGRPDPMGRTFPVDLAEARQAIGLLKELQRATRGNLSADEAETLDQLVHDAQMAYVEAVGAGKAGGAA